MDNDTPEADAAPCNHYAATHPELIAIQVRGARWQRFLTMIEDAGVAKLVTYRTDNRFMLAWVACLDADVADQLVDGWDG